MVNTFVPIASQTLTSTTTTITLSGIPQTYTDLVLRCSVRCAAAGTDNLAITVSNISSGHSYTFFEGSGSAVSSLRRTGFSSLLAENQSPGTTVTANTFSSVEFYIPSYVVSQNKPISVRGATENAATNAYSVVQGNLWKSTSAVTSLAITLANGDFAAGSSVHLYGVSNGATGVKATGGQIYSDGTYVYHAFYSSGTFTPTTSITADYLMVAGGGGGGGAGTSGNSPGTGAGAGGLIYQTGIALSATAYSIVIGAGGTSGSNIVGTNGNNTTFNSLTAVGGGYGTRNGGAGGSGGSGAGNGSNNTRNGGLGTAGQGNDGGVGGVNWSQRAPSGGGAGAVGQTQGASSGFGADGGAGLTVFGTTYAGGGGGGGSATGGSGGSGGGGQGGGLYSNGTAATANTGGGGGGGGVSGGSNTSGGAGGSGIVIVRYLA